VARYRLTVRNGSSVSHESFGELDDAISALRAEVDEIRGDGPLDAINALRDFEPGQRVQGRLEISTGGLLRGREVGIDVMGDGSLVAYSGVVRKRRLVEDHGASPFDAVREALS
jgi:hypothetical protein